VTPLARETEPAIHNPAVPLIDLTGEETVPLIDLVDGDIERPDDDVEILEVLSHTNENTQQLEPLDPDTEYRQMITHLFVDLDQFARSIFDDRHSE